MINPIKLAFKNAKEKKRPALLTYTVAGDNTKEKSLEILKSISKNVDICEIGFPHNTPIADGGQIQTSAYRALKNGLKISDVFQIVRNFKKTKNSRPVILMGYYNPIYQYGNENFIKRCLDDGVDGLIVVDLPPEHDSELCDLTIDIDLDFIRLATPTTDKKRLNIVLNKSSGFLYYVSIMGITGTKKPSINSVKKSVNSIKKITSLPVLVGFGINSNEQIKKLNEFSDGCVVGSAIIKIVETALQKKLANQKILNNIYNFLKKLKKNDNL